MASKKEAPPKDFSIDVSSVKQSEQSRGKRKLLPIIVLAAIVLGMFAMYVFTSHRTVPARTSKQISPTQATTAGINAGVPSSQAAVAALGAKLTSQETLIQSLQKNLGSTQSNQEKLQATLKQLNDSLNQQLQDIATQIAGQQSGQVKNERNGMVAPSNSPGLANSTQPSTPQTGSMSTNPDNNSFPYVTLSGGGGSSLTTSDKNGSSLIPGLGKLPPLLPKDASSTESSQPAAATSATVKTAKAAKVSTDVVNRIIPALSYVHVTLLNGVDCPVTNAVNPVTGSTGSNTTGIAALNTNGQQDLLAGQLGQSVPVTMPVIGSWHGPNGTTYTLGHANLLALCVGVNTRQRPTAYLALERLSYVGPDNKPHYLGLSGYVIDRRDNDMGLRGVFESESSAQIYEASKAAALAALGNLAVQSSTTSAISPLGSTAVIGAGQVGRAAAGSAIGSAFNVIAKYWATKAEQSVDVISVPSGVPVTVINDQPIQYVALASQSITNNTDPPY